MTEEEHEFGKALIGLIAIALVSLLLGFCMLGETKTNPVPINYIDDVSIEETKRMT